MTVGKRIKELRESHGYSQVEFADKIGVSKQTLYKYEKDVITNIPSDKIELAAKLFNVSPGYLMGWDDIPSPKDIKIDTHDNSEISLVDNFRKLNDIGKAELLRRSDELIRLGYTLTR